MKKYLLISMLLLVVTSVFASEYIIGTGTSTQNYVPFRGNYDYSWSKTIYTKAQINAAGLTSEGSIDAISYYIGNTPSNYLMEDQRVYIRHTTLSSYGTAADSTGTGYPNNANFTLVFQGNLVFNGGGWFDIILTTPFFWNNDDNIEILWENWDGDSISGNPNFRYTTASNTCVYKYQDNSFPATVGTIYNNRPNIKLGVIDSTPNPAVLIWPPDNGGAFNNDTLVWASGGNYPIGYDVYLDTVNGTTLVSDNQTGTTYTPVLEPGTTYYWKVVPYNGIGSAVDCSVWSFKTPTATQLAESFESTTFPPVGWANPGGWMRNTTTFKHGYASVYKPSGSSTIQYLIYTPKVSISTNSTLEFWSYCSSTSGIMQVVYSSDCTEWTQVGDNIPFAVYNTWYHNVIDLSFLAGNDYYLGFRTASAASFYVDAVFGPEITPEAPAAPTLVSPANGAEYVSTLPTFKWNAPTTGGIPTYYTILCDTLTNPTTPIGTTTALSFTPTEPLEYGTQYYWTVKAENSAGSSTATPFSFTTVEEGIVIIGTGTSTQRQPFGVYYGYERSAALYTNAQIGDFGILDKLAWNCATTSTASVPYKIYVMQTNDTALTAMTWADFTANATLVDEGTHTFDTTGWYLFELDNPFPYYSGNLVIGVETNYGGGGASSYPNFYYSTGTFNSHQRWNADNNPPTGTGTLNTSLPNIMLHLSEPPEIPTISVSPSSWDFGQTLVGTTKTKDFTITNIGVGTLSVSSIDIEGDYYTLTTNPAPIYLASLESTTFTVEYAPLAAGHHNGTVTITDNTGITIVELDGDCYDPTIYTLPWLEDFGTTGTTFPPPNWFRGTGLLADPTIITSSTAHWIQGKWLNDTTVSPVNYAAKMNIYGDNKSGWLITPPVQIPGTGYQLKFDIGLTDYNNHAPAETPTDDRFIVLIGDGSSWSTANIVREWNNTGSPYVYDDIPHTGENVIISLDNYTGIKYIAFYGESIASGGDNDFFVDNVMVCQAPAAPIFSYFPDSIDFGEVPFGIPIGPQNVTVTNTGSGTLNLSASDINILGSNAMEFSFSSDNLPASLEAGQSVIIPVYVTANTVGPISATLRMTYAGNNYDVGLSATGLPEGLIFIGNGNSDLSLPIEPSYGYTYSQSIFLQSEINIPNKRIEKISYYWNGAAEADASNNWTIYMGHTNKTTFTSSSDWIPRTYLTQVFSGEVPLPAVTGWIEIILDVPFNYNNTDNLVIAVDENESAYDTNVEFFYCTNTPSVNRSIRYYSNSTNPDPAVPPGGTLVAGFPNVKLQLDNIPAVPPLLTLIYPENSATDLPITGFNLIWGLSPGSGAVEYYRIYLASSGEGICNEYEYCWETTNIYFNPVTDGHMSFEYGERWYWTVLAHNDYGDYVVDPPHWFEIEADPRFLLPYTQDFGTDGTWPLNWTQSYSGGITSNRWSLSNTSNAGGTPYEMKASYVGAIGVSRLISPPINTENVTDISVQFRTRFVDYIGGITAKLQYSYDLTIWYDTSWSILSGGGNVSGLISVLINDLNSPITYLSWTLDGNHYNFENWYIDDVGFNYINGLIGVPEVIISNNGMLSWAPVNGATKYSIYKATDPYGTYSWYADVYGTSWTDPNFATDAMAFYKVTAVGGMRNDNRQ